VALHLYQVLPAMVFGFMYPWFFVYMEKSEAYVSMLLGAGR
jgi:hypothetical protein